MTTRPREGLARLAALVARLRGPDGCPWDREQQLGDLRAYLLEEAHEVAAAIDDGDWNQIASELGDLLFHVVFISRLGEESGAFSLDQVVEAIERKMIARHPHVFGDDTLADAPAVRKAWERRKLEQPKAGDGSLLDGVAPSLPALVAAYRMTQKAAGVGFDWPHPQAVLSKVEEELAELRSELDRDEARRAETAAELGDLLFTVANLARHLGVDPEAALSQANRRFRRRFMRVEQALARQGRGLTVASLEELDRLWNEAKTAE